ncbi:MAG: Nramp family divalent metal transporter [Ferruginibacter sp.]
MSRNYHENSLHDVHESVDTTVPKKGWRKIFSFLGPAYLISVGYMDPGNWATDLAGGSKYGYTLIWVLLMSNLMALLLQGLSARLGIVRRRDLAQANREEYPMFVNFILYILAEIAIAATDLAEVLGMAIGIQLLTGLPLIWGVSLTVLDTFLLLHLQRLGIRKMEAFIITLVAFIGICFLIQIIMANPDPAEVVTGFIPSLPDSEALFISIGIIGATVMPHNLYLHSSLVQTRKINRSYEGIRKALKYNRIDTTIALNAAFLVNAAILILAASVFYKSGNTEVAEIKDAYRLLPSFLGDTAPILFALALIAAGQSSTVTGTLAGQIIMEGYLNLRISPILRRLITRMVAIIPAFFVILIYGEDHVDSLLIFSQVILSFQLAYAIIPLIHFVSDKKKMGKFVIPPITQIAAWAIAVLLIFLNIKMVINELKDIVTSDSISSKILIFATIFFFIGLLIYIVIHPYLNKKQTTKSILLHKKAETQININKPVFNIIAVALDFSGNDEKVLSYALAQGNPNTEFKLIHIVESASAKMFGTISDDYETRKDKEQLDTYVNQLKQKGLNVSGELGYRRRVTEIVRITNEVKADILIVGSHGHKGIKDFIFGSTIDSVRHKLKIPVLVVTV